MSGNVLREKVSYEFSKLSFQKTVELLATMKPEHRTAKQCKELLKIVNSVQFFKESIVPMTDEDALAIAKRLRY
jgi:hypothetical protein